MDTHVYKTTWRRMRDVLMPAAGVPQDRGLLTVTALFLAASAGLLIAYAILAGGYAYWRPDTWQYLGSPHNEFEYNYRWLVPLFYYGLKRIPSYAAWLLAALLYGYFGYTWARRYLRGAPWDNRLLALLAAALFLLNPGLQDQFTWPNHSLAAISILAAMAAIAGRVPRIPLVLVGTCIVFGVHQSFAFLTLLFLVPSYAEQAALSQRESLWYVTKALCWWGLAFLLAWAVTQLILYLYFGYIPQLSAWRLPHPAHSIPELWTNLVNNMGVMVERLGQFYSSVGAIAGGAIVVAAFVIGRWRIAHGAATHIDLVLFSLALYAATYVITAPVGTVVPFRLTLVYGPAAVLLMLGAMASARRPVLALLAAMTLCAYPALVTLGNMHWFGAFTAEITASVIELRGPHPRASRGVLLEVSAYQAPEPTPEKDQSLLLGFPRVFAAIQSPYAFTPAFYEAGFSKVFMCDGKPSQEAWCSRLHPPPAFTRCSATFTGICSGGYSADGFWLVRL